jgi:hypothetical protein
MFFTRYISINLMQQVELDVDSFCVIYILPWQEFNPHLLLMTTQVCHILHDRDLRWPVVYIELVNFDPKKWPSYRYYSNLCDSPKPESLFVYFYNLLDIIFINFSLKLTLYPFSNVLHKIHFNQSYATSGITCRQFLCNCYIRIYNEKCFFILTQYLHHDLFCPYFFNFCLFPSFPVFILKI